MAQCHAVIGIAESKVAYGNGELAIGFAGVTCGYTCLTTRIAGEAHGRTSVTTRATIFTRGGAAIATGLATCAHGCTDLTSRLRTAAEGAALCTRCQGHFIGIDDRSEEHTSELQSLMRISYAVFCLKKKNKLLIKLYI